MVKLEIGGGVDIQKIHRLVRSDEVLVGYPDGVSHPDSAIQNSDLARALHFGTAKIPARPFLYQAIASIRTELQRKLREMYKRSVKEGKEPEGEYSLEGIGALLVGAVQRFVRGDYFKSVTPNAPSTIAAKGSDTPLIDTGFMINSENPAEDAAPDFLGAQALSFVTKKVPPKTSERRMEVKGETP
jgi:hypothetical protein